MGFTVMVSGPDVGQGTVPLATLVPWILGASLIGPKAQALPILLAWGCWWPEGLAWHTVDVGWKGEHLPCAWPALWGLHAPAPHSVGKAPFTGGVTGSERGSACAFPSCSGSQTWRASVGMGSE